MRFTPSRDYDTILRINKELVNDVVDVKIVLYKIHAESSPENSYGEATKKSWYSGVEIPCLIQRDEQNSAIEGQTVSVNQTAIFAFLRQECIDRGIYPEIGDIIDWDTRYYEIDGFTETQLFAGRTDYKHSIKCSTHLTRKTNLQLEKPQI